MVRKEAAVLKCATSFTVQDNHGQNLDFCLDSPHNVDYLLANSPDAPKDWTARHDLAWTMLKGSNVESRIAVNMWTYTQLAQLPIPTMTRAQPKSVTVAVPVATSPEISPLDAGSITKVPNGTKSPNAVHKATVKAATVKALLNTLLMVHPNRKYLVILDRYVYR